MILSELTRGCGLIHPLPAVLEPMEIADITCDSRQVVQSGLFLAVAGHAADGHDYIAQAFEQGAGAVIAQNIPKGLAPELEERIILVQDSRKATAAAAANFFGHPSQGLTLVGITGTNGKTTITWILESIFRAAGFTTGVIGTVNIRYKDIALDNPITTPDPVSIQKTLGEMKQAGVTHVFMEVSSHSLDQYRVDQCQFDAAVFTNLTQDHLDYHATMEAYFRSKEQLFTRHLGQAQTPGTAVINIDHEYGRRLAESLDLPMIRVGTNLPAEITALNIKDEIGGLFADLELGGKRFPMHSGLTGKFNLENILCAAGASHALGVDASDIIRGISSLSRVPGRLEKLDTPLNRHIFVDYAHTPDALASILKTLSQRAPARLITVFGCGGDRDRTKRGPMGQIACAHSDIAIVTSDNPRTESPKAIVADIVQGIQKSGFKALTPGDLNSGRTGYLVEVDREKALELAVKISKPQDIIVAAGKGHETYQITNAGTIHFDDMEKLARACDALTTPKAWTLDDLEKALAARSLTPAPDAPLAFTAIGTDSRTMTPNMVFLALAGENFDGHDFVPALVKQGIRAFVVKTGYFENLDPKIKAQVIDHQAILFETPDTQAALGRLAHFHRMRSNVKLVAITGSNGKTTTRKMTQKIFGTRFDVLATQGNFNNEIGMPLTLLRLAPVHEWAVIEMGMNHPGEILRLSAIARPDIAIITNTAGAHLEGLKTQDNVARAKSEIFKSVEKGGTALIFGDDPRQQIMADHAKANPNISHIRFFGQGPEAHVRAQKIQGTASGLAFTVQDEAGAARYRINTPARFMVNNSLAAIAAARVAGLDTEAIRSGLKAFTPVRGRMSLGQLADGTGLIDDAYNANPDSMTQALNTLSQLAGKGRGIAALGDMLELGEDSDRLHREIGHLVADLSFARVCLFGTQTAHLMAGALEKGYPKEKIMAGTKDEIAREIALALETEDWLLIKGSRGMAMEAIIPELNRLIERKAD